MPRNYVPMSGSTFYEMCVNKGRQDLLDIWDYDLNNCSPHDIPPKTNKPYYFKCKKGIHDSTLYKPANFWLGEIKSETHPCKKCASFYQWAVDNVDPNFFSLYWDYEKNTVDPWEISACAKGVWVWIKCQNSDQHPSYSVVLGNFRIGSRCPCCGHNKLHSTVSLAGKHPESISVWSDKNGTLTPFDVFPKTSTVVWWKCPTGLHNDFERSVVTSTHTKFRCPKCSLIEQAERNRNATFVESFYDYCIKNSRMDFIERWDYELNNCTPKDISSQSGRKFFFKCSRGLHESTAIIISQVSRKEFKLSTHPCKKCNSFAQWGIDNLGIDFLDRYWDYNKNTISPWDITNQSPRKVWIKCDKKVGHESYDVECPSFHSGARCPYCSHTRLSIENSLVERYPKSIEVWSSKNSTSPQDFSYASGKKAWWKCPSGKHQDFYRAISDSAIVCEFRCPKCYAKGEVSNIQKKVCEILDSTGYTILHESNCTISPISPYTGRKLRYDNQVLELSIIVEVHGEQHYKPHSFSTTPCDIETMNKKLTDYQKRDKFKKEYALSHGFSYLEIPYYDIRNGKYIQLIEDAIESAKYKISIMPLDESSGFLFEESLVVI